MTDPASGKDKNATPSEALESSPIGPLFTSVPAMLAKIFQETLEPLAETLVQHASELEEASNMKSEELGESISLLSISSETLRNTQISLFVFAVAFVQVSGWQKWSLKWTVPWKSWRLLPPG